MSWTTALTDIRTLLDEGDEDKLCYRKRCLGECNAVNLLFKTFDSRRTTDFTTAELPLGVWLNGVLIDAADVTLDFPVSGDFELADAPIDGDVIEASYYFRWFIDSELTQFLTTSSEWLALGSNYTNISESLRPAALNYAAGEAYQKLALKWTRRLSEGYMLNDAPATDEVGKMIQQYGDLALKYQAKAKDVRDDFYSRSGTQLSPSYGFSPGRVRDNVPKE